MPERTPTPATTRPLRADAQLNRERLLESAVRAFSREGPDATLDAIAKDAGVGIGTLYRRFPTREALIEAAYRNELARLCDAAPRLRESMPADAALREWMDRFLDYMRTKRGMADALRVVIASAPTRSQRAARACSRRSPSCSMRARRAVRRAGTSNRRT